MKKMMIIAVMIGAMLMPAQISAQNSRERRGNDKVRIEKPGRNENANRKGSGSKAVKNDYRKRNKIAVREQRHMPASRPVVIHEHSHRPAPQPVVIHEHCHRPAPRPVVIHEHCNSEATAVAAVAIGAAALISLLAD